MRRIRNARKILLLTNGGNDDNRDEIDALNEHEEIELAVVTLADAIVYPGTMVVHLEDTTFTCLTVVTSWRLDSPTNIAFLSHLL